MTQKVRSKQSKQHNEGKKRWYAVYAYSGFEQFVAKTIKERIKLHHVEHLFGDILVPTEEVVEMRAGQKKKSQRRFFPNYVLVQAVMSSEVWHLIKSMPKVRGFIGGNSEHPAPISEKEMDVIFNRVEEGVDKPKPKVLFEVGEVVRVVEGPFADFNNIVVEEVNYEKNRLRVSVSVFGRPTPVELEFSQIEKV